MLGYPRYLSSLAPENYVKRIFILFSGLDNTIRTEHFDLAPHFGELNSVRLTSSEVKVFAGHALRLVRNKCPSVDHLKLFKIQKCIARRLALLNHQKPDDKEVAYMANVLQSMQNCSKYSEKQQQVAGAGRSGHMHIVLLKLEPAIPASGLARMNHILIIAF